jgi:hypothetical protein
VSYANEKGELSLNLKIWMKRKILMVVEQEIQTTILELGNYMNSNSLITI